MSYPLKRGSIVYKRLVAGGLAVILSGCALFSDGYSVKTQKEEQESDYSSVYAEVIEFDGFKNKEYESELNMAVREDVEEAIKSFDALALEAKESLPKGVKSALSITQKVKRNTTDIISFITEVYTYTGGAHGTTLWIPVTVNVTSENPHNLKLSELFSDKDYISKLNAVIAKMVEENPEKYGELWAKPEITSENENRFYMTDTELVIFFPPYELSYYAKGFIEFAIPYERIAPILKDRYKTTK